MQWQTSLAIRRLLAGLLSASGLAYGALLLATYLQITAPSSLAPELSEIKRLLFNLNRPVSSLERRLEISNTPLGTGPLVSGETSSVPETSAQSMRFAFASPTNQISQPLGPGELAEREGERQALLDWVRFGANRNAYEQDDYPLANPASIATITPSLLLPDANAATVSANRRVRIRSLIHERCVICHNEAEGDDTARLVPLDTYESIARYLMPDAQANGGRAWLFAALFSLFPLAALVGPVFAYTSHSLATRRRLLALTTAALFLLTVCWLAGPALFGVVLPIALAALICIMLQWLATVAELWGIPQV